MGMCSSKLASCFQWISSCLDPYEDLPTREIITTAATSLPSSSSSASPPNLSMASSSRPNPYEDLPTPEIITTASTSLPSSSSSSASPPNLKLTYEVFLSFRGEDTRNNIVGHLYKNLTDKGIITFLDNERLERGKEISPELLKAIKESRFAIIIFSENYASSSWCLDELVHIIDCTKKTGQRAYPVFYNVDPSNVRKQEGSFAKAFEEHEKKNLASGNMEKWREALTHAGGIAGWDTRDRLEAEIIQEIVKEIYTFSSALLHVDDNIVGMEIHMNEISTHLDIGSNDVKFVGIHGLGGIGKTTTAKVLYNWIYNQFEGCSYLANVRETFEKEGKLVSLQKQLLREILKVEEKDLQIFSDDRGSDEIRNRLNKKKVLIILDDVDHVNQLEKLAGNGNWFGPGSIIIITTRDQHLLNKYEGVQRYEVKECDRDKSLEIFSWKAFKQNYPPKDYMDLSNEVVHYANGLPLALTVLGSHLLGRSKEEWRGAIRQLSNVPNEDVTKILKISYKGLNRIQKNVFLDIACFFNGEDKEKVMEELDSFGFFPNINIPVLIDKSLITVSAKNELMMHDLVRDMGRYIVHQESPNNPRKRSRLWNDEDILRVLKKNMATEAIQGIQYRPKSIFDQSFKAEAFMEMENLRFLELSHYCEEHFALDFLPDKLVHLSLSWSSIKSLWNGRKPLLPHLKSIDLSDSKHLREFPDVTGLPKLERLNLRYCRELIKIHPSVWVHKGLKFLDLIGCSNLSFPNKIEMESLETLHLHGCKKMKEFPEVHGNMKCLSKLNLYHSEHLRELQDVTGLQNLEQLDLSWCMELVKIHPSVWVHKRLKFLDLSSCCNLESFPNKIEMESLETLHLRGCEKMKEFPEVHGNMKRLSKLNLSDFEHLRELQDVTGLQNLERLNLRCCKELVKVHPSVWVHKRLKFLDLRFCCNLESFPNKIEMESLETLHLRGCEKMKEFPEVHGNMKRLSYLDLSETKIKELPSSIENFTPLKILYLAGCQNLVCLPNSICKLKYLEELDLDGCSALEKLPENIGDLESLVKLDASGTAIKEVSASIQSLDKLRILSFAYCRGLKLPSFHGLPSSLTYLNLCGCDLTDETFPSNIECLSSLKTLYLGYNNFESLPTNITQLSLLTKFHMSACKRIKSIPEFQSGISINTYGCTALTSLSQPYPNQGTLEEWT